MSLNDVEVVPPGALSGDAIGIETLDWIAWMLFIVV